MEQLKAASVPSAAPAKVPSSIHNSNTRFQEFVCAEWPSYTFTGQHLTAYSPYEDLQVQKEVLAVVCVRACVSLHAALGAPAANEKMVRQNLPGPTRP